MDQLPQYSSAVRASYIVPVVLVVGGGGIAALWER